MRLQRFIGLIGQRKNWAELMPESRDRVLESDSITSKSFRSAIYGSRCEQKAAACLYTIGRDFSIDF